MRRRIACAESGGRAAHLLPILALGLWLGLVPTAFAADTVVGKALFTQGAVSAQMPGQGARLLGKDAPIHEGDRITTGSKSFAVLEFVDGAKTTLRPDTVFAIDTYRQGGDKEGVSLGLVKGGLRTLTGAIGKRNPENYRLKTPVATIGIRGTEYDGRLCETDCAEDARHLGSNEPVPPGLYVGVYDGGIWMCQEDPKTQACRPGTRIDIPKGKGGYSDGDTNTLLAQIPGFLAQDVFPRPSRIDWSMLSLWDLMRDENNVRGRSCELR